MTVNAVVLGTFGIVQVADSRITFENEAGQRELSNDAGRPKIVALPQFFGAMSWFGTVKLGDWNALDWLKDKAEHSKSFDRTKVDLYADYVAVELNKEFETRKHLCTEPRGIGIHFSFFDNVAGVEIPELIFITNFDSISSIGAYRPGAPVIQAQRQTFHLLSGNTDYKNHYKQNFREVVYQYLRLVGPLELQNGENPLFNASFQMVDAVVANLILRKTLNESDPLRLAGKKTLLRAEIVAKIQEVLCTPASRFVGSPCHNLMISPSGEFSSDTALV